MTQQSKICNTIQWGKLNFTQSSDSSVPLEFSLEQLAHSCNSLHTDNRETHTHTHYNIHTQSDNDLGRSMQKSLRGCCHLRGCSAVSFEIAENGVCSVVTVARLHISADVALQAPKTILSKF